MFIVEGLFFQQIYDFRFRILFKELFLKEFQNHLKKANIELLPENEIKNEV